MVLSMPPSSYLQSEPHCFPSVATMGEYPASIEYLQQMAALMRESANIAVRHANMAESNVCSVKRRFFQEQAAPSATPRRVVIIKENTGPGGAAVRDVAVFQGHVPRAIENASIVKLGGFGTDAEPYLFIDGCEVPLEEGRSLYHAILRFWETPNNATMPATPCITLYMNENSIDMDEM